MSHVKRFFFAYPLFKNRNIATAIVLFLASIKQKITRFTNVSFQNSIDITHA